MPAINDRSDMLAMCLTVLMGAFTIFLIVGTLAFIFGNDDKDEKTN